MGQLDIFGKGKCIHIAGQCDHSALQPLVVLNNYVGPLGQQPIL